MKKIYKYIGLLFGLICSINSYSQNQVQDPGFEEGCSFSGWSSVMYDYCGQNYNNWPIEGPAYQIGVFAIAASGSSVQSAWHGFPHTGNEYFVGDGIWTPVCTLNANKGWFASGSVYQGNPYIFTAWYRYEDSPNGIISLGFNPSNYSNNLCNNSNTKSIATWNQLGNGYLIPSSSTNPTSVELDINIFSNQDGCDPPDNAWGGNDFGLDDICFGPPCDGNGNPPAIYYQNTNNLPAITYGSNIEAGYQLTDNPNGGSATLGNVEVQASQNVTFVGGEYVE